MRRILLLVLVLATAAHADLIYRATVRSRGKTKTFTVWLHGNHARVVDEADPPDSSYALVRDGEKVYLVDVGERQYLYMDLKQLIGPALAEIDRARQARVSSPQAKLLIDEPGPEIAGTATRHYRFRLSVNVELHQPEERFERVLIEDFWTAPTIQEQPVGVWQVEKPDVQLDPAIDAVFRAALRQMQGFPLKRVTVMTLKTEDGNSRIGMRSETEVLGVKSVEVPESQVALPEGYKQVTIEGLKAPRK